MILMVHLAIVNLDGLTITVVRAPFALRRGGASPVPSCASIISLQLDFATTIFSVRNQEFIRRTDDEEGYSPKLSQRLAVVSGDNTKAPCGAVVSRMMLAVWQDCLIINLCR
jgi:hypothetical protein